MEQFCKPTTRRYQGILEASPFRDGPFEYTEVQLAVPLEDFLVYRWDWNDLKAFLSTEGVPPKILWITQHAFLAVEESKDMYRFENRGYIAANIQAMDGQEHVLILVQLLGSVDTPMAEFDVFWRAVATSNSVQLTIRDDLERYWIPLLWSLLEDSPLLRFLELDGFLLNEESCRALASLQGTDLEVRLTECKFEPEDAEDIFIEWFRHNQVVTKIDCCQMGSRVSSALSGNKSVKRLKLKCDYGEEEMRSMLQALPSNRGIEKLTMVNHCVELSDEIWSLLFRSLSTHPRIEHVSFDEDFLNWNDLTAESKTTRMNAILQMLQNNTVVHILDFPYDTFDYEEVYQNIVLPRLEMNRNCFEVERQAVKRADPAIRSRLLGRALHMVRYNPNLVFHFLSENVPAFVRTEVEEEEDSAQVSIIPLQHEPVTLLSGQKRKAP
jgi:hypothetical protein